MAKIDQIAQSYLTKVAANPGQKHEICRQAAYTFMGLAQDPKNARVSQQLSDVGLTFARAAGSDRPPVMDDFADLLKETQIAYEQAGSWGDDPMDLIARRREIHEDRTPRMPGQIFITPESFNRDATLGRAAQIKWQPTEDDKRNGIQQMQTVAFWQGVKKEAQAMTVDVNLTFLPNPPPGLMEGSPPAFNQRPYSEVEFGSDGNKTRVKFDLALGKRLTVVGNYISVLVGMDPPLVGTPPAPEITAGASIGAFAAPSLAPLVATVYVDSLTAGTGTPFIPIPLKAALILPLQYSATSGNSFTITLFDYGGNPLTSFTYTIIANQPMTPIPIYGDAAFLQIFSQVANDPINPARFRIPFQLAL